jgi:putative two-component system response regulator
MSHELTWSDADSQLQRTALVVDDESHIRKLLSRWLHDDGWTCQVAPNAAEALAVLDTQEVKVVTCDLNMPGHSGLWLLERIVERFPDTSILMLTASSDTQIAIDALTHGAAGYMLKPVKREEFLHQVRKTWEHGQLREERREYLRTLELRVQEQTVAIQRAHEETIHRLLTAAACRDEETGAHIRRTGLFAEVLALTAGWSSAEAEKLRMAAPMHDVGKIGIPDAILRKPGKLTPEEYEIMKQHTLIGAKMLSGSNSLVLQLAETIARGHHERWDGTGYPNRLAGEQIPEAARILAIVDVYDALSHDRVYRPAFPEVVVLWMLREGQGTQFDPALLTLFFTVHEEIREISAQHPDVAEVVEALPAVRNPIAGDPAELSFAGQLTLS